MVYNSLCTISIIVRLAMHPLSRKKLDYKMSRLLLWGKKYLLLSESLKTHTYLMAQLLTFCDIINTPDAVNFTCKLCELSKFAAHEDMNYVTVLKVQLSEGFYLKCKYRLKFVGWLGSFNIVIKNNYSWYEIQIVNYLGFFTESWWWVC